MKRSKQSNPIQYSACKHEQHSLRTRRSSTDVGDRAGTWATLILLLSLVSGCGKDHARAGWSSSETGEGTPAIDRVNYGPLPREACTPEGAVKECGRVYATNGDYVTCSVGHATCTEGSWTECVGDHFVVKSAPSLRMTSAGLRFMATGSSACTNACDPYCQQYEPDPAQVNTDGIVAADAGGVTLEWKGIEVTDTTACVGLQCQLVICGTAHTTTISGRVYDPAGKNPLYNAEVYIPLHPTAALPAFGSGASCDTCGGAEALDAIRATQSDANGNFTLSDVPAGSNVPVIVQMGKWRREIVLSNITSCTDNKVTNNCTAPNPADCAFRLPRNQNDGYDPVLGTYTKADMPQTAIISGSADPFDCLLLKAGIDPAEVGDSASNKRIHFYASDSSAGSTLDSAYGANVKGSELWNNFQGTAPNMMSYDVVLLPCEGGAYDKQKATGTNTPYKNLVDYANAGGRAFATHYGYSWLAFPAKGYVPGPDNWDSVATWTPANVRFDAAKQLWIGSSVNTQDPMTGTVNTAFPKGSVFSQWLSNVRASSVPQRLMIHEGRQDLAAIGSNTQSWMTSKDLGYAPTPNYTNLFTFNTPYSAPAADQCGRVVYSDFHVSAAARTQCPSGNCEDECLSDQDCGFTATCNGETPGALGQCDEPCTSSADCPNTSFSCDGVVIGTCGQNDCSKDSDCGTGRTCQSGSCTCTAASDCNGGACVSMTCDPGSGCHSDAQCGANGTCGEGVGAKAGTCAKGAICHKNSECGPTGTCGTGSGSTKGTCARTGGTACHKNNECDSNSCGSGSGSTAGTCARGGGTSCHGNSGCDSNSCGTGTGSTLGSCSTSAQSCHLASDCDSNSCGTGSGSVAGTCGTNGQICHSNAQCDSNACGSGTGSAVGVCSTPAGTSCHKNLDCDNTCGTGTGSTAGTCNTGTSTVCHSNAQCDSNACGTGTGGSLVGLCSSSAAICHTNAQCDSNACGTGTNGSTKGTCNGAGTCTSNANCTGGATCNGPAGNKRCTGGCSLDTNCGTGGVCNNATCANKTCSADTACTKGVNPVCNGATCTVKSCANDSLCGRSGLCNGAKCANPIACANDAVCLGPGICNGAKCGNAPACAGDLACSVSDVCNGAKCSTKTCGADTACTVGGLCNGAKCSNSAACAGDTACPSSGTCNNAKCSTAAGCAGDAACPSSGLCNNAKCSTSTCGEDSECPLGVCTGATCNASDCSTNGDCATGAICGGSCSAPTCTSGADCASGSCQGGVCGCAAREDCGGSQECNGELQGSCARACTTDAECAPDRCVNGQCGGCASDSECHDYSYEASCEGIPDANYGTCSDVSDDEFPVACKQGELSPQEKALEFMFFDLTACVSPDNLPPPKPVTGASFGSATFVQDFIANCPSETLTVWREFNWQADVPDGASIDFSAQSGDSLSALLPVVPLVLGQATSDTDTGPTHLNYDAILLDTGSSGTGAFNTATPAVASKNLLRITIGLNPTADKLLAPRLAHWKVQYDCLPGQ